MDRTDRPAWPALLWAAASVPLLGLFALSVPAVHARKLTPTLAVQTGLDELGVPVSWYAAWWTVVLVAFAAVCFTGAAVIAVRRPREPVAWSSALLLVALGAVNAPSTEALVWRHPGLEVAATVAFQVLLTSLVLFLFTFPDGRLHPRWSWIVVAGAVCGLVVARGSVAGPVSDALLLALVVALGGGLAAQVHRYRRTSTAEERQQTRWVTLALVAAVTVQIVFPLLEGVPALSRPGAGAALLDMASPLGISLGFALLPLALTVALLRTGLWGLDVVVNRALVYGTVTVALLGLYLLLHLGVATALGGSAGDPGDVVGSLLAAAAVALALAPVRARTQRAVNRLMYGQRDEPYQVLSALGQRLESSLDPHAVLQTIADTVARSMRSPHVVVAVGGTGPLQVAAQSGDSSGTGEATVLPLVHRHQTVGELRVAPRSPSESYGSADRALLGDLARQAGAAVHAVQLAEQLQHSRERLVTAREEERRRLRRDLHDGLGPALASMTLQAETAGELVADRPEVAASILVDLVEQLQSSTADIRRLVYDLRPPALDDLGLAEALRMFVARSRSSRLQLVLDLPYELPPLSAAAEVAVYRVVQEAVVNVLRHAQAHSCTVRIEAQEGTVTLTVEDDGAGFGTDVAEGVGLRSMRERASELGGACTVTSAPGQGTRVRITLPRAAPVQVAT